jgi:DNA-directed RNA polymerase specialized sigma24 family protein
MNSTQDKIYEEVIKQAKSAIKFAIRKYGNSLDDKEDIFQDCCLAIWRYLETILSIDNIRTRNSYIIKCCQNVCINRYRKIRKYEKMKITVNVTEENDDDEFFENCFFREEANPESILSDRQINYFLRQLETAKLLIKILKI